MYKILVLNYFIKYIQIIQERNLEKIDNYSSYHQFLASKDLK